MSKFSYKDYLILEVVFFVSSCPGNAEVVFFILYCMQYIVVSTYIIL